MKTECGPGMAVPVSRIPDARGPWWYDYGTHEIVRSHDGRRFPADEVPELQRSLEDRKNPVVDVDEIDRWVLAQSAKD